MTQGPRACVFLLRARGRFHLPVRTLRSLMKELGHDHLDVLKLDVEGSE